MHTEVPNFLEEEFDQLLTIQSKAPTRFSVFDLLNGLYLHWDVCIYAFNTYSVNFIPDTLLPCLNLTHLDRFLCAIVMYQNVHCFALL